MLASSAVLPSLVLYEIIESLPNAKKTIPSYHTSFMSSIAWSLDDNYIASTCDVGMLQIYDLNEEKNILKISIHDSNLNHNDNDISSNFHKVCNGIVPLTDSIWCIGAGEAPSLLDSRCGILYSENYNHRNDSSLSKYRNKSISSICKSKFIEEGYDTVVATGHQQGVVKLWDTRYLNTEYTALDLTYDNNTRITNKASVVTSIEFSKTDSKILTYLGNGSINIHSLFKNETNNMNKIKPSDSNMFIPKQLISFYVGQNSSYLRNASYFFNDHYIIAGDDTGVTNIFNAESGNLLRKLQHESTSMDNSVQKGSLNYASKRPVLRSLPCTNNIPLIATTTDCGIFFWSKNNFLDIENANDEGHDSHMNTNTSISKPREVSRVNHLLDRDISLRRDAIDAGLYSDDDGDIGVVDPDRDVNMNEEEWERDGLDLEIVSIQLICHSFIYFTRF